MLRSDDDEEGGGGVIQDDGEKESCAGIEIVVSGVLPAAVVWFIAKLIGRSVGRSLSLKPKLCYTSGINMNSFISLCKLYNKTCYIGFWPTNIA
ncbi:hypothetical protein T08_15071 [Trichinella sp. T8]|nr:hypothetical protein T08_9794 [Trichinella sp. T8]KRZ85443.1 hypothetical protein T08_1960 [Trichinella sp. T8]KRZ85813.1 hypothetical protein T08_15071 [Trichinella sp. T8]